MKRPYFIDEFVERISFSFQAQDYNPIPNSDGVEELKEQEGTKGNPHHLDYEPTWHRENEWDDDFQFLWKWAGNHGIYDGGEWHEIRRAYFREDLDSDFSCYPYIYHPYSYGVPSDSFFQKNTTGGFFRLIQALEGTSEEVVYRIQTKNGAYGALTLDDLKEEIEEECWQMENQISYSTSPISKAKEDYVAYELKGLPAERNGTAIITQDDNAFFVGHKVPRKKGTLPSEEAKVLRGEIRDDQVIPEHPREEFAVMFTSPERIYDVAEEVSASQEVGNTKAK
jgi:hypothetical protein